VAVDLARTQDSPEFESALRRCLELEPTSTQVSAWYELAKLAIRQRDAKKLQECIDAIGKRNAKDAALASLRCRLELLKGNLQQAEQIEQEARNAGNTNWMPIALSRYEAETKEQGQIPQLTALITQTRQLCAQKKWTEAFALCAKMKEQRRDSGEFWFEYAALAILADKPQEYFRILDEMIARSEELKTQRRAGIRGYHVARAVTLLSSEKPQHIKAAEQGMTNELNAARREFWAWTQLGAMLVRQGGVPFGIKHFQESLRASSKPGHQMLNHLWLAVAELARGDNDKGKEWLAKGTKYLDQMTTPQLADRLDGLDLHGWLEGWILRRIAEAVLKHRDKK
jgi:thioredoxin-like negative regulator of GroEL